MEVYLIPLLVTLAVFVALIGVRAVLPRRQRVTERLQEIRGVDTTGTATAPSLTERPLPGFLRALAVLGWVFPNLVQSENLQWDLAQAGFRREGTAGLFVGAKVALAIIFGVVMFLVGVQVLHLPSDQRIILTIAAAALGFYLPNMWLSHMGSKRAEEIRLALPDALDLMVVCVEAGQGINAAIMTVGREMFIHAKELSEEMRMVGHEIRAGLTRAQALRNFASRTGVDEARSLVAVLIQSDRLGTSIAQALRVHAQSMRTRRRQRAEEAARKTAVKLLFPLIFCIFPALLVVILAPAMIQIFRVLVDSAAGR
jgi:tight adherence protein C